MSSLKTSDKVSFERLFDMGGGYVLDFVNSSFQAFFSENAKIDIMSEKYAHASGSKANRLRAFWTKESDALVAKVMTELLDYEIALNGESNPEKNPNRLQCRNIVKRLSGQGVHDFKTPEPKSESTFLSENFSNLSFDKIGLDTNLVAILHARHIEAIKCFDANAYLATIFLCGSILEGLLLGYASSNPRLFNQAPSSPKDSAGSVKKFYDWKLAEFIDVASAIGVVSPDVKHFSHGLRQFRNYIHPHQQMAENFEPDEHTAKICLQVLNAAIADVAGTRSGSKMRP